MPHLFVRFHKYLRESERDRDVSHYLVHAFNGPVWTGQKPGGMSTVQVSSTVGKNLDTGDFTCSLTESVLARSWGQELELGIEFRHSNLAALQ